MPDLLRLDGTLVTDGHRTPQGCVVVDGDRIRFTGATRDLPEDLAALPSRSDPGLLILPGLVDLHHHGGAGGEYGPSESGARTAVAHHRRAGSTTLVGSLVSNTPEALIAGVDTCARLVAAGELDGVHLEGPFLSEVRCGAQNPAALTDPSVPLIEHLAETADAAGAPAALVQMTFAPERDLDDAVPAALARHGIIGAIGHTDCDDTTARRAIDAIVDAGPRSGRALATHLFNGMRPLHHREPGPIAAALAAAGRGDLVVEAIGDGVHLAPGTLRLLFDTVGPDAIALITDSMSASGMPDGAYTLGALDVVVAGGVARLAEGGAIAGGIATMLDVLRLVTTQAGVPLEDAVTAATATPASVAGFAEVGRLAPGYRADLVLLREYDDDGTPLVLDSVLRAGRKVV